MSRPQQIFSEIELFLEAGKYEDAKVLSAFLDHEALDRESRLRLLLINATLDGPAVYQNDIDRLRSVLDPSPAEKELIRKILLVNSKPAEERARKDSFGAMVPAWPNEQVAQPLEQTAKQYEQLLRTKEAALSAAESRFEETVGFLEKQLGEKQVQLEQRDAEIQAIRSNLDRLAAQIEEIDPAKDREARLLRDALARKTELLQDKDAAMKKSAERLAGQISALEDQLGEKQSLLEAHETEINSLIAKMAELNGKYAELASQREESERWMADELREKATLLQAAASAIDEVEAQSEANIQWLECELTEKQILLDKSVMEWTELCRQIDGLARRLGEVEKARNRRNASPHEERDYSPPERSAAEQNSAAEEPIGKFGSRSRLLRVAAAFRRDHNPGWPSRLGIGLKNLPMTKTLSAKAAALAGAGLLIIPLAYIFSGPDGAPSGGKKIRLRESPFVSSPAAANGPPAASRSEASPDDREFKASIDPGAPTARVNPPKKVAAGKPTAGRFANRRELGPAYVTRRAVALRAEPRFAAASKAAIRAGTFVSVLAAQGSWLKVRSRPTGAVGYVRKEFLSRLHSIQ